MKRVFSATFFLVVFPFFYVSPSFAAIIGYTEVPLNGLTYDVRTVETNLGNLIADSFLWQAQESGQNPTIAVLNGAMIRGDAIHFPGATVATPAAIEDTDISGFLPFGDIIGTLQNVSVATFLSALENSVSQLPPPYEIPDGRFLQIAGFNYTWDPFAPAGSRIVDVYLNDGTTLVQNGVVVSSLGLNIAANHYIAQGGDFYSWGSATWLSTGVGDNVALSAFLQVQGPLEGLVRAADYPVGGEGRIQPVPEPATMLLLGSGLVGLWGLRRKLRK
jgi:5'-nucleotidase/UDP-sugar diphosphatase